MSIVEINYENWPVCYFKITGPVDEDLLAVILHGIEEPFRRRDYSYNIFELTEMGLGTYEVRRQYADHTKKYFNDFKKYLIGASMVLSKRLIYTLITVLSWMQELPIFPRPVSTLAMAVSNAEEDLAKAGIKWSGPLKLNSENTIRYENDFDYTTPEEDMNFFINCIDQKYNEFNMPINNFAGTKHQRKGRLKTQNVKRNKDSKE
ncbi:MAG: hypothetical protein JW841_14910 [Deltaproteobacteria bacterium]|nr:hypothetical protein [Deltaproteobacteria bacterium]